VCPRYGFHFIDGNFLAGRSRPALESVAEKIEAAGGAAEVAVVDVLDEGAVDSHANAVVSAAGSLDISFNAISLSGPEFRAPSSSTCRPRTSTCRWRRIRRRTSSQPGPPAAAWPNKDRA
jgi:hypothetical protein